MFPSLATATTPLSLRRVKFVSSVHRNHRMQSRLLPDPPMLELLHDVRRSGLAVGLVSNSLGRNCYAGFDLDALFDAQAISGHEGVRKPSRRLYEVAGERLGIDPTEAVMIDDLAQNITAAGRLGMGGIVHTDATSTRAALAQLLGNSGSLLFHSSTSGHELEEAQ